MSSLWCRAREKSKDSDGKEVPFVQTHLVFAEDGRLAERQTVLMPSKTVMSRHRYGADGTVTMLDPATDKVVREVALQIAAAPAPNLKPATKELVVMSMPLRTSKFWEAKAKGDLDTYDENVAINLMASYAAEYPNNPVNPLQLYGRRFHAKGDRRIGFYVLLAGAAAKVDPTQAFQAGEKTYYLDVQADHQESPLAEYLAHHFSPKSELGEIGGPEDGFIQRLSKFRALWSGWQNGQLARNIPQNADARQRTLQFVGKSPLPIYDWALLLEMCKRGIGNDAQVQKTADEAAKLFKDDFALHYSVRYEVALGHSQGTEANELRGRQLLSKLYVDTLATGLLPPLDSAFHKVMVKATSAKEATLADLFHQSADALVKHGQRLDILSLASQAQQLGDLNIAESLLNRAMELCQPGLERAQVELEAAHFYRQTGKIGMADKLLRRVLTEEPFKHNASLWRLASEVASQHNQPARAMACLDQALELEFRDLPPVVDLQAVRSQYGQLLSFYQQTAFAMSLLEQDASKEFVTKVVRAADRWRSLEPDPTQVCMIAGKILQSAGASDLAWDYLTTPISIKPNESAPWLNLAKTLQTENSPMLADRAFVQAYEAEPTNAQILWDRAANLMQAGRMTEARAVYRMLAEGEWQERFAWIKEEAKRKVR